MRILYSSNAPWVGTGYGVQCAITAKQLQKMGHDVAIFAFWGQDGAETDWEGIPVYPNPAKDWGQTYSKIYYDDFKADLFITHIDAFVLTGLDQNMNWVPRMPVDHDPVPPMVVNALKSNAGLIKPIVESKFGQRKLADEGIESFYIPPAVDCQMFKPRAEYRKTGRERYGWQDKFVVGMVGTNHDERKNWVVAMKAMKVLADRHPGKVIFYMHTDPIDPRGINLAALRASMAMETYSFLPSRCEMAKGIDRLTLARTYNVFDVFLLPTKGEGACVPITEAQACGVPVITTKCTSHEETVSDGWFCEMLDPVWTHQNSWQFLARTEEVLEHLESAYREWETGAIKNRNPRRKALEYDIPKLFKEKWTPALAEIEEKIKQARNREGIQQWRVALIPKTCVPRKVLDIGCGITQPYKLELNHLGEYVGVDVRDGHNIVKADAKQLPFGNGEFGFVWCSEVLEHCEEPEKVVAEAKRVGKHGIILFSTPFNPYFAGDPDHKVVKGINYTTTRTGDGMIVW